jgi:hypothetical protein
VHGEPPRSVNRRARAVQRAVGCAALVALALVLGACSQDVSPQEAEKAARLDEAGRGISVPPEVAASLYGTDGGAVCAEAADPAALGAEAAAGVSHRFTLRRTEADGERIAYLRAVVETYCPDEAAAFEDYVRSLAIDPRGP